MKFNLKTLAIAAALVAAGSANAAFQSSASGTFAVLAFDTVTGDYYLRDTGFTLNTFLPNSGSSITQANEVTGGATFDKTPAAGLVLDKTTTTSFADASFSSWLTGKANVKWTVIAADTSSNTTGNRRRLVAAIDENVTPTLVTNSAVNTGTVATTGFNDVGFGLSKTGVFNVGQLSSANGNYINQTGLTTAIGSEANLYYWTWSANSATSAAANQQIFSNINGLATVQLASNGDFTYTALAPVSAVPLPAAAWLMGAGLVGLGGMIRRRKATAQA